MSKQSIISSETQLREAARALWKGDADIRWRWKEWEPRADRGIDALGETVLDGRRTVFVVEFKLSPGARDVEALAKRKGGNLLLIAPNISDTLLNLCRERGSAFLVVSALLRRPASAFDDALATLRPSLPFRAT